MYHERNDKQIKEENQYVMAKFSSYIEARPSKFKQHILQAVL
jgi:hypothetical protein